MQVWEKLMLVDRIDNFEKLLFDGEFVAADATRLYAIYGVSLTMALAQPS